ncbi:MAG TPA: peptide ABC transporter substrate-binding protein [Anaerolineales bacterium]|nr:peptide ABC transporter substrate-binding protein [Anaerolineales bacterium]
MRKLRWQLLIVFLALAAIAVLLFTQQPARLPGIVDTIVQPETGGVYSEALVGSFARLNPLLDRQNAADRAVNRVLFRGLMKFDDYGNPVADVAESWGNSQDGTVYNFSIRPDAVWHDGAPITSQDVMFTVALMQEDAFPVPDDLRAFWQEIEVLDIDEKTLQFRLPEPFSPFLDYLTFGLLPEHLLGQANIDEIVNAEFNLQPVGNGPFQFDRLLVEEGEVVGVALRRFEDFYGDPPFIEELIFRYYPDAQAALTAYQTGEVMGVSKITTDTLADALREPGLNMYTGRLPRLALIFLNQDNADVPFFQEPEVRRALLAGINRQWMIDYVLNGQAIVADGPILPGTWAYYEGIEHHGYDPQAAIKQLQDAGYTFTEGDSGVRSKEGVALTFELLHPDDPSYAAQAAAIQKDLAKIGVQVELVPVPYDELAGEYLQDRSYEAALVDINLSGSPDPDPYPFWHQSQIEDGQNYSQWDDRQASEYLEQGRTTVDAGERARLYRNFQVRFTSQMPALPLYFPVYSYGIDEQVQGVRMGPLFDLSDRLDTITSWFLLSRVANQPEGQETAPAGQETTAPTTTP